MPEITDVHEALLRALCRSANHVAGVVVDAGVICREQQLNRTRFYAAILALADAGLLDYLGVGPRVALTEIGLLRCTYQGAEPPLEVLFPLR